MRQPRDTVVDAVVVVALFATVLSLLDDTFADRRHLLAGLVPVVLLVAGAVLGRRVHEGGWWYLLGAVVLFAPLGVLAALRDPGPFLVPTVDTMSRVLAQSVNAPQVLVSTVPPVDPVGVVMLAPFLIGFLAGVPAAWFAVASDRPLAPAVPVLLALAATIPLSVLTPSLLVPRAVLVTVVALVWSTARARRGSPATGARRGAAVATVVSAALVGSAAGIASLAVPHAGQPDRVLLRGDDVLVDLRPPVLPTPGRDDVRLLRVDNLPPGHRIRFAALDVYDGTSWVAAPESPGSDGYGSFRRVGEDITPLHPGTTTVVRVRVLPGYSSDWLPTAGELTRVDFDWNPGRTEVQDVRYNQATSSALVVGGVDVRDRYSFESVLGEAGLNRLDATRDPTEEQRQPAGAFLDESLRPFDRDDLLPLERVLLLARYLRDNGTLRTWQSWDQSPAYLEHRMLGTRGATGSEFQFSAAMALGASRLGVPARLVTGAEPDRNGRVDYGDVVSWVELQLADGTWRTLEPERYVGSRVVDGELAPTPPEEFVADQVERATEGRDREIRPSPADADEEAGPTPAEVASRLSWALLAAVVLVAVLAPVSRAVRRLARRRTRSWSGVYVAAWQEVLDTARDLGRPVPEGWSRVEQARRLGVDLALAREADAAVFAPAPAGAEQGRRFWQACQEARRELLRGASRRRRVRAWLSPASLVAGWARRRSGAAFARGQVRHEDRGPRRQPAAHA